MPETTLAPSTAQANENANVLDLAGTLLLACSCSIYGLYGIRAYPRQEWLLEVLVSLVCLIPCFEILIGLLTFREAARWMGGMLIARSFWDALHWPAIPWIQTPVDPLLPQYAPFIEIPLALLMILKFRSPATKP